MAEAIVSVVMNQLVSIIRLELEQEVRQVVGVRKEVTKLTNTLELIKAVLDDAEKKQFHENAVKVWIGALKDIMYDADDVLDEWYTTISISQSQHKGAASGSHATNKVLSFFCSSCSCFQPIFVRHNIALRIKDIRARLDDVSRDKEQLSLIQLQRSEDNRPRQLTSSIVDESEIQGRDHDKTSILSRVLSENSDQGIQAPVPIICIVGMGGLGKTTLAQLVFNDEQVTETFKHKIWVCVSEPFDRERVAKEIIVQAEENVQDVVGWQVLHQRLCSSVRGKRFLLVLDDVWSENPSDWTPLKDSLVGGVAGSRIIITTRSEGVAKIVGASYIHLLKQLPEDHCWSLFRHIAFQGRSRQEIEKLEEIGREIASKCKGVPLATKTVGSLMRFKQSKQEWRSVLQSDIWKLGKDLFPALQLSYHSLPTHLKQCFIYTAIFPKDTRLKKDRLVKLWMAQGFVRSDGGIESEMIAVEYFDELVMRSFFQDFEKDADGKVIRCKMHDFIHDMAQSLTKDECHIMETNDSGLTNCNKVRHVNASNTECSSPFTAKNLRTLILKSSEIPMQFLKQSFLQSTCLRALDLHGEDLEELPDEVQCLVHLRYLDLSGTKLSILPETLCNLYNLQTLKLNQCEQLGRLPEGIGRLSNLRHLEVEGTHKIEYIPQSIGKLSQLRTLHKFVVSGANMGCKVGELRQLNSLSGGLQIHQLRQVENMDESKGAQMLKKKDLGYLRLDFDYSWEEQAAIEIEEVKRIEGVLEGLQPNANLEELGIHSYPGLTFPFWMSSRLLLCNVTTMKLFGCRNCNQLPGGLGQLPSLEELYLVDLGTVKHVGADLVQIPDGSAATQYEEASTSASLSPNVVLFPKLTRLRLEGFPEWTEEGECEKIQEITKTASIMPNLQRLWIHICPKLKELPPYMFPHSLRILNLADCPQLKVIPCLPPLLEKMQLWYGLGVVSTSLMSSSCDHDYPNLKTVEIHWSPHSTLPQGLSKFTSLHRLIIWDCSFLDLKLEEELRRFPTLQELGIYRCPVIRERCEREDWANTLSSHIAYNIKTGMNGEQIYFTKRR